MIIEVIFRDKIGPYNRGQVASFDQENAFLKALLLGKKAEVLNPPDWEFGVEHNPVVTETVLLKDAEDGSNYSEHSPVEEGVTEPSRKGPRKKGSERIDPDAAVSTEGYGSLGEFVEDREDPEGGSADSSYSL